MNTEINGMIIMILTLYRSTFPSRWELTARTPSATNTQSTRCLSTRLVRLQKSDKEREDMMLSKLVSVVKPSLSSERRPRPQRRSLWSLNAQSASSVDSIPSSVASHSFSERRTLPREESCSDDHTLMTLSLLSNSL